MNKMLNPFYEEYEKLIPELDEYTGPGRCYTCKKDITSLKWYENSIETCDFITNIYIEEECLDIRSLSFERLDRTDSDKPKIWPCYICYEKQGGGCIWYSNQEIDLCTKCYSYSSEEFIQLMKSNNKFVQLSDKATYKRTSRGGYLDYIVDITIPKVIEFPAILEENGFKLHEVIDLASLVSTTNKNVCDYYTFLPLASFPIVIEAYCTLAVNCNKESPEYGYIASVVYDDHYRCALDNIYTDMSEFINEYNTWNANIDVEKCKKEIKDMGYQYKIDTKDAMKLCYDFSCYIRLKNGLSIYYG